MLVGSNMSECPSLVWIKGSSGGTISPWNINSLTLVDIAVIFKLDIYKLTSRIDILSISYETTLRWKHQNLTNERSTLVQVMANVDLDLVALLHH